MTAQRAADVNKTPAAAESFNRLETYLGYIAGRGLRPLGRWYQGLTTGEKSGMEVIEPSFIESIFGIVLVANIIDKVRYAAASSAAFRDQVVRTSPEEHLGMTLNQDEREGEREEAFHLGLGGGGVYTGSRFGSFVDRAVSTRAARR
jgi:hypothetical protein